MLYRGEDGSEKTNPPDSKRAKVKIPGDSGPDSRSRDKEQTLKKQAPLKMEDHWLSSNLVVKMVDREYKKGRHYTSSPTL